MNKDVFLSRLESSLGEDIDAEEKKDILFEYRQYFSQGLMNGASEEEIARSLDDPLKIAKRVKATVMIRRAETNTLNGKLFRVILATCNLSLFNRMYILWSFLGLVGVLFGLFITGISVSFAGLVLLMGAFLEPVYPWFLDIPVEPFVSISQSLGITVLGVCWTMVITKLIKWAYKKVINYLKTNIRTVKYQNN